jgi:hypothetical protein
MQNTSLLLYHFLRSKVKALPMAIPDAWAIPSDRPSGNYSLTWRETGAVGNARLAPR